MVTYYVSTDGANTSNRDGLTWETAWASLSYASTQVPEGSHTIQLGPGDFIETQTVRPPSSIRIAGTKGPDTETRLLADDSWPLSTEPGDDSTAANEYIIDLQTVQNVSIQDLVIASQLDHLITGAIRVVDSTNIQLHDLTIENFRWAGLHLERSEQLDVYNNIIKNASQESFQGNNGLIRTRFIKHSQIHHNTIIATDGSGYGYKGGGHENVRIHHNTFSLPDGFAIESAHENEFGVEIDHNIANQTISVPKGRQSADPGNRGYEYTFWIHHNLLSDSYTIEGPRNHLRVSHNYIRIDQPNGRVYTHHGGNNHGPIWIHHNVIENVDRALIWMNRGLTENIYVFNNTVFLSNSERAGAIFSAYSPERINNWIISNNIIIAPDTQPRSLFSNNEIQSEITATNNILVNINGAPNGNFIDSAPELAEDGTRPFPFYSPSSEDSFAVDRGIEMGIPFVGSAPDIGAYEWGETADSFGLLMVSAAMLLAVLRVRR